MNLHSDETIRYYDQNADEYVRSTVGIDMSSFYEPFLAMIPRSGRILDAGCGSGRDTKAFLDRGYAVTAFDASERLAASASQLAGVPVQVLRFQDMAFDGEFDGVWASASLLHVPRVEMHDVIRQIVKALRIGGTFYASFKLGSGERFDGERLFTDFDESKLRQLVEACPESSLSKLWTTKDARSERCEQWINILARK